MNVRSTGLLATALLFVVMLATGCGDIDLSGISFDNPSYEASLLDTHPTWSPDGRQIAFRSNRSGNSLVRHIWVVPATGGEPSRLTDQNAASLAWSPDGTQIAFGAVLFDSSGIWVVPATGGRASQITFDRDFSPSWSPDGTRIAFHRCGGAHSSVWVIPVAGDTASRLTSGQAPVWSPDGTQIAFYTRASGPEGEGTWVIPATGGSATQLSARGGVPSWSPDGTQIAFRTRNDDDNNELWIVPSIGGAATLLTSFPGWGSSPGFDAPSWSPDGRWIAYHQDLAADSGIFVVPTAGGDRTRLDRCGKHPAWSPDGSLIAFDACASRRRIWVIPTTGGSPTPVTPDQ